MKKYSILTLALVFGGLVSYAQQGVSTTSKSSEPTMANGIPYSQYKAQQDAAKQASIAADSKALADAKASATVNAATNTNVHAPATTAPAKQPIGEIAVKTVPEPLPAALKGTSLDPNAKPVVTSAKTPVVNVPERNSGNTQADVALTAPAENAKAVDAKPAPQTSAAVRPLFNLQPSTGANAELSQPGETNAATTNQTPEVKIDASRAVPMEEVKPSAEKVTQPKVPVASKQGSGN